MPGATTSFDVDRRALLRGAVEQLCGTMIPRTDTPDAVEAGVPAFLDALMANWASPAHQAEMRDTVARLTRAAQSDTGKPLAQQTPAERLAWLTATDAKMLAARDAGYGRFKQLVMTGYYYSEAGATEELRYELIPGKWEPSVPITADTRAWAA
jgi:gluconate 2-dehydrogenase gamma chain